MSNEPYDIDDAAETAWGAVREVSRLLTKAIEGRQQFSVTVSAGDAEDPPVRMPDGTLCATGHLDGSYEIHISIKPPTSCPKRGTVERAVLLGEA